MQNYASLVAEARTRVREIMPWDLSPMLAADPPPMLLDVREPGEFARLHLRGSINVPRGVLEQACEWDYEETVPTLAAGRDQEIVLICRNGNRSVLAADVMLRLGFGRVVSLRSGLRGWVDYEQPVTDALGAGLDVDAADALLASQLRPEQRKPKKSST